jgi:hypothetical protein
LTILFVSFLHEFLSTNIKRYSHTASKVNALSMVKAQALFIPDNTGSSYHAVIIEEVRVILEDEIPWAGWLNHRGIR